MFKKFDSINIENTSDKKNVLKLDDFINYFINNRFNLYLYFYNLGKVEAINDFVFKHAGIFFKDKTFLLKDNVISKKILEIENIINERLKIDNLISLNDKGMFFFDYNFYDFSYFISEKFNFFTIPISILQDSKGIILPFYGLEMFYYDQASKQVTSLYSGLLRSPNISFDSDKRICIGSFDNNNILNFPYLRFGNLNSAFNTRIINIKYFDQYIYSIKKISSELLNVVLSKIEMFINQIKEV